MKADNVFIQHLEGGFRCAIGDLDTAKMVTTMEKAKTVIGTPLFIAPEVLESRNENVYTPKADGTYLLLAFLLFCWIDS